MERRIKVASVAVFLIAVFASYAFAIEYNPSVPDTFEVRQEFANIITGSNNDAAKQQPTVSTSFASGWEVLFKVQRSKDAFYFIFINGKAKNSSGEATASSKKRDFDSENYFPLVSPGSYVIKRDLQSGNIDQIKIFLNKDADTFVRVVRQKNGRGSALEFSLFGVMIYNNVLIPSSMETLITEPFSTITSLSDYIINWDILIDREKSRSLYVEKENMTALKMSSLINISLPNLKDIDDGAQDKDGNFIFIEDFSVNEKQGFNCSGFAKWVSDGIFSAKTSRLMDVSKLKKKALAQRRDTLSLLYEDERDPFFGLDWTRNIAMTIYEIDRHEKNVKIEDVDVRNYPYSPYMDDIGYSVRDLKAILYYLTVKDPGYIYLASINGNFGSNPVLRQHYHVAVSIPYITPDGEFVPAIYERNRKTDIDAFIERYKKESVHLVRVKGDERFKLPSLKPQ